MNHLIKHSRIYLSIFSGLMTALPFVVPSFGILAWFSLVPLFVVLFKEKHSGRKTFMYGFLFGLSFYIPLCSWLYTLLAADFMPIAVLFILLTLALLLVSAIMALGYGFLAWNVARFNNLGFLKAFLAAVLWGTLEFLHREAMGQFGFTWGNIALTQYNFLPLIQSASLFGSLFTSFIIVLFNSFLALGIMSFNERKKAALSFSFAALFFIINVFLGIIAPDLKAEEKISAAMVRSNDNPFGTVDTVHNRRIFKKMISESEKQTADIILWSETSLALIVEEGDLYDTDFCNFTKGRKGILGVGCYRRAGDKLHTCVILYENGKRCGYIDKRHPVPFGEYIPFGSILRKVFPFINDVFPEENEVAAQEIANINKTSIGEIGGIICYDSCFPSLSRESVKNGAQLLLMSTNDSWFYGSHAIENHLSQSVFRAVENGRYIVRCANKGINAIISPKGEFTCISGSVNENSTSGELYKMSGKTLYTQVGDIPVLLLFAVLYLICIIYKKIKD